MVAGEGLLTGQHQARLNRVLPDARGEHLIHADAAMQHGAPRERHSRQNVAGHAGVDAHARQTGLLNRPLMTLSLVL